MTIYYEDLKVELPYTEKPVYSFVSAYGDPAEFPTKEFKKDYKYSVDDEKVVIFLKTLKPDATIEDAKEFEDEIYEHFEDDARSELEWEAPLQYLDWED